MFKVQTVTPSDREYILDIHDGRCDHRKFETIEQIARYLKKKWADRSDVEIYYTSASAFVRSDIVFIDVDVLHDKYFSVCCRNSTDALVEIRRYEVEEVHESQI